jgi:hypothetical protein
MQRTVCLSQFFLMPPDVLTKFANKDPSSAETHIWEASFFGFFIDV